ncbi:predicted protein [Sclerotinia sclerotiorum 1980 UF-70]|uniref:Uncharacterized protein n=1 Tax=Sclerotinia sclerotiorum (strain ATCC 18683 / 1980 / Ss-1) TaxID=665079 RepID=A7EHQ3_SCLS1|nr:predicted protein [Sclerotinia sclerotiorum 1980 UF-70]EDO02369.1 predicted protein [Sclerotinia sclerotiorum 1980 UF-70]
MMLDALLNDLSKSCEAPGLFFITHGEPFEPITLAFSSFLGLFLDPRPESLEIKVNFDASRFTIHDARCLQVRSHIFNGSLPKHLRLSFQCANASHDADENSERSMILILKLRSQTVDASELSSTGTKLTAAIYVSIPSTQPSHAQEFRRMLKCPLPTHHFRVTSEDLTWYGKVSTNVIPVHTTLEVVASPPCSGYPLSTLACRLRAETKNLHLYTGTDIALLSNF